MALLALLRAAGRAPTPIELGHRALAAPADVAVSPKAFRARRVWGPSEETKEKEEVGLGVWVWGVGVGVID